MADNYIFGINSVRVFIEKFPEKVTEVFIESNYTNSRLIEIIKLCNNFGIKYQSTNKKTLDKKSNNENHQGIILKIQKENKLNENDLYSLLDSLDKSFLLVLDGITDPHNLGACIRTAEAAGVSAIILPKNNSSSVTPVVKKIASGAADLIPVIEVTNLVRVLKHIQNEYNTQVYGTSLDDGAKSIHECTFNSKSIAIIMGSEDLGIRELTKKTCDELIYIPMYGKTQSLNISVATGIALFKIAHLFY
ncbi:MAG: 23S rRNA (guanosine(2251)-2'-O)-methyltransferase RlmB [Psittacicella sp.]